MGGKVNTPECGRKLNLEKICGITDSDHRSDFVHTGVELCDDNNLINGDGCSSTCTIETTGQTCAAQGGFICAATEICPGTELTSSDAGVCCSVACVIPVANFCNECGTLTIGCDRVECQ
ncbi:MAG: hypothetical protein IH874_03670 [Candidatus Dadabacteria bacterium]|nr:hypothetical protein [Candidatus Dadabacteria bacterium]